MRLARASRASGPTGSGSPVGGEAQRQEPKEMRARSSPAGVRITEGGNDGNGSRASGHTRSPSTWTSYGVAVPGVRPVTRTSA